MKKIAIIDYEMSNLNSINNALEYLGFKSFVTSDFQEILSSDGVILPGVGAFPEAMNNITRLNLIRPIAEFIRQEKPLLGICLGMQLLFDTSEEFRIEKGLGFIEGCVKGFKLYNIKPVPHVGWNKIKFKSNYKSDYGNFETYFYFVHSFFSKPKFEDNIIATSIYNNLEFCSIVKKNNVMGCQFHPEKSGDKGLNFLEKYFNNNFN